MTTLVFRLFVQVLVVSCNRWTGEWIFVEVIIAINTLGHNSRFGFYVLLIDCTEGLRRPESESLEAKGDESIFSDMIESQGLPFWLEFTRQTSDCKPSYKYHLL